MMLSTKVKKEEEVEKLPQLPLLKRWRVCAWACQGLDQTHVHGDVYRDPRWPDGFPIVTGRMIWLAGNLLQTKNTLYELEKV